MLEWEQGALAREEGDESSEALSLFGAAPDAKKAMTHTLYFIYKAISECCLKELKQMNKHVRQY